MARSRVTVTYKIDEVGRASLRLIQLEELSQGREGVACDLLAIGQNHVEAPRQTRQNTKGSDNEISVKTRLGVRQCVVAIKVSLVTYICQVVVQPLLPVDLSVNAPSVLYLFANILNKIIE